MESSHRLGQKNEVVLEVTELKKDSIELVITVYDPCPFLERSHVV